LVGLRRRDRVKRIVAYGRLVWEVVQAFNADKCSFLAAGLCYFVFFSIFPMMLLLVSVTGYFLTAEQAMQQAVHLTQQLFPQQTSFLLGILKLAKTYLARVVWFRVRAATGSWTTVPA
jgi:uncharacterized BrkB/YihY/UPF0761 family membrane protein